ncbi:hypothetical protein GP486_001278, partial [Trichoglossum hirsutum]
GIVFSEYPGPMLVPSAVMIWRLWSTRKNTAAASRIITGIPIPRPTPKATLFELFELFGLVFGLELLGRDVEVETEGVGVGVGVVTAEVNGDEL